MYRWWEKCGSILISTWLLINFDNSRPLWFLQNSRPAVSSLGAWFSCPFSWLFQIARPKRKEPCCQALLLQGCIGGVMCLKTGAAERERWFSWPLILAADITKEDLNPPPLRPCEVLITLWPPRNCQRKGQIKLRGGGRQRETQCCKS